MKNYINQLQNKGYVMVENYLTSQEVETWQNNWESIRRTAILEEHGWRKNKINEKKFSGGYNILYKEDNNYVFKSSGKVPEMSEGKKLIEKVQNDLTQIDEKIEFLYDKFINQKKDYQGHSPHQDNSIGVNGATHTFFTANISLTDTNEESGCIWVEDINPKRTENLHYCDDGCVSGGLSMCHCQNTKLMPTVIKNWKGHNMIPLPMKKGDCVFFDGWVLHGTAANLSENIRQTIILHFAIKS